MRIVYGVHGYGRGHATRALAVVRSLSQRHEVLLFAGGDAHETLGAYFPVRQIPCLTFAYHRGRRSNWRTFARNLPLMLDLAQSGPIARRVTEEIRAFAPDAVICDAEPWTSAAGQQLGVPRIGFDHFGVLVHCRVRLPFADWLRSFGDRLLYRALVRWPERVLVSSFFAAEPKRSGVRVIGPLLGDQVEALEPAPGDHLLAYFNQGSVQVSTALLATLAQLGREVRLYGLGRVGTMGPLTFRAPNRESFLSDLASCRAVLSTAGNQLIGEAIALAKPVLAIPEATVEQRLNAREIVRLGIGESLDLGRLTTTAVLAFLARAEEYAARARELGSDGRALALEWIERWLVELAKPECARGMRAVQPA